MTNPIYNMNDLMKRVKSLQVFTVEKEMPEDFNFNGSIPYDIKISDGMMYVKVYAVDFSEANQRVDEFIANNTSI